MKSDALIPIIVAIIGAIAVILVGYWQFVLTPNESQVNYVGRVMDAVTHAPIQDAKVTLENGGAPPVEYSDSEGGFSFLLKLVDDNNVINRHIRVQANGYETLTRYVSITTSTRSESFKLKPLKRDPVGGSQSRNGANKGDEVTTENEDEKPPTSHSLPYPPPYIKVTRVDGKEFLPDTEIVVGPSGTIEGTLSGPVLGPWTIEAQLQHDSYSLRKSTQSSGRSWALQNVPFRTPLNNDVTNAIITISAQDLGGTDTVSPQIVRVQVPAPAVNISWICGRPVALPLAGCAPFTVVGTATNVLENEEKIAVKVSYRTGGHSYNRCIYADIVRGEWRTTETSLSRVTSRDRLEVRSLMLGLVDRDFEGLSCSSDLIIIRMLPDH